VKLRPVFKLLVCIVLFSAGLWAGRSEAAGITFDEFGIMHGSAISASVNAPHLMDFGFTVIAGKPNIPGWPEAVAFNSTSPFYDVAGFSGNNSANRIDPIIAVQSGLSRFDWVEINFGGPATVDNTRSHLKNVFWPNIFVGASFQIFDMQQDDSDLKLGSAALVSAKPLNVDGTLNQNPIFEMTSRSNPVPEPASMLLVGAGLIVLAGIGRKKFFHKRAGKARSS
jgi:hypothetical protein